MPVIKLVIIDICFLFVFYSFVNADQQINNCLSAASVSVTKWSKEQTENSDRMSTMKFLKCLHYCLVYGKSIGTMSEQLYNCFHTQTLMMNLWNDFLSRRDVPIMNDSIKCFERINGKVLIGSVDKLIRDVESVEGCEQKCKQNKCHSAAYYSKEKECILTSETKATGVFVDDSNSIYLENLCLNNEKPVSGPNESTNTDENITTKQETTTQVSPLSAEVIDSYGMTPKQHSPEIHFQFKDQVWSKKECFSEFYPPNIKTSRVERVQSLDECVNKCRKTKTCSIVGYSVERQLCALAPKQKLQQLKRDESMGNFIFMKRIVCE